ncbi:MAG: OmpH family outer membrane protein [Gammaproteobacteria bacterium]
MIKLRNTVFALLLVMAGSAFYTPSLGAQELKLGFVNAPDVLEKAPQAELARSKLEQEFAPRLKALEADQKKIRQLEEQLSRDGAIMSEGERNKLERDIRNMKRELKRERDEYREDLNIRRNEELAKLQKLVVETIRTIAKEQGYDLVVADGVFYASQRVDITALVLDSLKKKSATSSPTKQ